MATRRWLLIGAAGMALALGGAVTAAVHRDGMPGASAPVAGGTSISRVPVSRDDAGRVNVTNRDIHPVGVVQNPGPPPIIRD